MAITPPLIGGEKKKHWWLTNRKIVEKYVKDAQILISSKEKADITSALNLLDSALSLSPRSESAMELKARSLLSLRRFKEVADMLQEYIPSFKIASEDSSTSSENSSQTLSKERIKLLKSENSPESGSPFKCFSASDLKKKVMAGLCKNSEKEGHWRFLVLGQACYHLGLMEDAMVLLQTGKRLATLSSRQESMYYADDSFSFSDLALDDDLNSKSSTTVSTIMDASNVTQLLNHIKILLCRRTAALSSLEAGHYSEAIRHFSKILDGRRGIPQGFLAECYVHRANAYRSAGRIAESIADCNRTLALEPTCIPALTTRVSLLETIRCTQDCLRDLEHLKLLYDAILRDRKLPGPAWRRHNVHYRDVPGNLRRLTSKIQDLKKSVVLESSNLDYYALVGLRRGCSRSELERAHLLLSLRHVPDKAGCFIDRCEFLDYHDVEMVKDQARMSALLLYRLLQKAYSNIMSTIMGEEAAEKQKQKTANALKVAANANSVSESKLAKGRQNNINVPKVLAAAETNTNSVSESKLVEERNKNTNVLKVQAVAMENSVPESKLEGEINKSTTKSVMGTSYLGSSKQSEKDSAIAASVFPGGFCRDIVIVGNMLSKANFNHSIPMKYEALSC